MKGESQRNEDNIPHFFQSMLTAMVISNKGPFKYYVMPWGMGVSAFTEKKCYEGVRLNVISVTMGWVRVKFPGKKCYVTLEWPLMPSLRIK